VALQQPVIGGPEEQIHEDLDVRVRRYLSSCNGVLEDLAVLCTCRSDHLLAPRDGQIGI
jgi:hypothetical protein